MLNFKEEKKQWILANKHRRDNLFNYLQMILKVFVKTTLTKQKHGYPFEGKESDFAVYILF